MDAVEKKPGRPTPDFAARMAVYSGRSLDASLAADLRAEIGKYLLEARLAGVLEDAVGEVIAVCFQKVVWRL